MLGPTYKNRDHEFRAFYTEREILMLKSQFWNMLKAASLGSEGNFEEKEKQAETTGPTSA